MTSAQSPRKAETKPAAPRREAACYQIEVRLKPDFADAPGQEALFLLQEAGLNTAREVRAARIYEIRGPYNSGHMQQAARELLCDTVTQEFRFAAQTPVLNGMDHWRVEVWLKNSVTDPVGETVARALCDMGLPAPESVRCATVYRVAGKCGRNHLEKAAQKCLINPVIHRFAISEEHA